MSLLVEGGGGLSGKHFPLLSTSNKINKKYKILTYEKTCFSSVDIQ